MTKTELWNKVQDLLNNESKVSKKLEKGLEDLLKPKSKVSVNPPRENENGELEFYCRYTLDWYPKDETIFQNDTKREENKSKGYSKTGISLWTKAQRILKDKKDELFDIMMGTIKIEDEEIKLQKMEELKLFISTTNFNDPEYLATLR